MRQLISALFIIMLISACNSSKLISKDKLEKENYQELTGPVDEGLPKPDKYVMYPNGLKGIYEHIKKTTRYPSNAVRDNIQGKVIVQFIVEKNGQVKKANVIGKVSEELDKEALRVILSLNRFYPGFKDGKPVRILYIQSVNFKLD